MKTTRRIFPLGPATVLATAFYLVSAHEAPTGARAGSQTHGSPQLSAPEEPRVPHGVPSLSFFAVGDTGWVSPAQVAVAAAMAEKARSAQPDLIVLLGDNFYRSGVASPQDEMWRTHFEEPFAAPELQIPFRPVLGNHDHQGNIRAQVEYSQHSQRWKMDGLYYAFSHELTPDCTVDFFLIDTTPLRFQERTSQSQLRWLEQKLATSKGRWKIVVGHHPIVSGGQHGGSSVVRAAIGPLLDRYSVDLYLSGHDHDLQLLTTGTSCLQLVSGSGSSTRSVGRCDETLFAEAQPGFAWILVSSSDLWIQFLTASAGPRFTHHISKGP